MSREDHYLRKYHEVADLILKGYSNDQLLRRNYDVEGESVTLSKPTLLKIRELVKEAKASGDLSGIFPTQRVASTTDPEELTIAEKLKRVPERIRDAYERGDMNTILLESKIEAATFRTENRFLKEKIEELRQQLSDMRSQGLGSVDASMNYQFLKKDYEQLNERHTEDTKELINLREENKELQGRTSEMARIKELVEMGSAVVPVLMPILGVINPQLGSALQAGGQLSGLPAPANPEEEQLQRQAMAIGSLILSNFKGDYYNHVSLLLDQLSQHPDLVALLLEDVQALIRAKVESATSLDNNVPAGAQSI